MTGRTFPLLADSFTSLGQNNRVRLKNPKGSISLRINIADMRIQFQIICNRNTEIFNVYNIFK